MNFDFLKDLCADARSSCVKPFPAIDSSVTEVSLGSCQHSSFQIYAESLEGQKNHLAELLQEVNASLKLTLDTLKALKTDNHKLKEMGQASKQIHDNARRKLRGWVMEQEKGLAGSN